MDGTGFASSNTQSGRAQSAADHLAALFLREGPIVKPVLHALLVADHVYRDAATGKFIVAGIFDRIFFHKQEAIEKQGAGEEARVVLQIPPGGQQIGSPFCYASLTDIHGEQEFEVRYVDLTEDKALFGTKFKIQPDDPVQTVEICLPLPMLPSGKAGTFALELLWQNEPLGSHRIIVGEPKVETTDGA